MNNFTRALAVAAILIGSASVFPACADTFNALVVGITDGDTIKVLKDDKKQMVRQ